MHVVIFEESDWSDFAPLALSRPVFTLASGASTLLDKQLRHLNPKRLTLWVRPELEEHCRLRILPKMTVPTEINTPLNDEPALLVNGKTLHFRNFEPPPPGSVCTDGRIVRLAHVIAPGLAHSDALNHSPRWEQLLQLQAVEMNSRLVGSLWDLIDWNEESLLEDSTRLVAKHCKIASGPFHLINEANICLSPTTKLHPGVVLDAAKGPIMLAEQVTIGANSVIQGPCFIGPGAEVRPLSLLRGGCSIGTMSKVGGEIANSIILGWSNKAHDGYLGDSYLGKWVNFGAGTTVSNLKNTYGEIHMRRSGRTISTGRHFLGAMVGDHTKTAIGTRLMAGSYLGFCTMIGVDDFAPAFVPSFSFLTADGCADYDLPRAIEVTKRVFARRNRAWTDFDEHLMNYVRGVALSVEQ